jgi:phosphate/sulfate permease
MSLTFVAVSTAIGVSVLADTRAVGQFGRWSRIRWTYVLLSSVPLVGHIAGAFYVLLRRLMRERTQKHRRRLVSAGFDVDVSPER